MIQARKISLPKQEKKEYYSKKTNYNDNGLKLKLISKEKFKFYGIFLACIILAMAAVAQYCQIVTTNIAIGQAESRIDMLLEEQRELEMNVASLNSLVRIEDIARNELAMEEAVKLKIFTVSQ